MGSKLRRFVLALRPEDEEEEDATAAGGAEGPDDEDELDLLLLLRDTVFDATDEMPTRAPYDSADMLDATLAPYDANDEATLVLRDDGADGPDDEVPLLLLLLLGEFDPTLVIPNATLVLRDDGVEGPDDEVPPLLLLLLGELGGVGGVAPSSLTALRVFASRLLFSAVFRSAWLLSLAALTRLS